MCSCCGHSSNRFCLYIIAIVLGIACGLSGISLLEEIGKFCSEAFVRIFRCVSMPIISLSVIVALSGYGADKAMNKVWKKTLKYTLATTIAAATVSAILYLVISPANVGMQFADTPVEKISSTGYGVITKRISLLMLIFIPKLSWLISMTRSGLLPRVLRSTS